MKVPLYWRFHIGSEVLPHVQRSSGWKNSKKTHMVSQLRISHGLPGCEIQQGQTALLCNLQLVFCLVMQS